MSVLVVGAYGSVGSHVVTGLLSAGVPVRGSSRTPKPGLLPDAVEVVRLDLDEPATLPAALEGVEKVFLYASPESVDEFVGAARAAGVAHVVLLSSAAVAEPAMQHSRSARMHSAVENALRESGMAWTFLRPTTFASKQLAFAPAVRAGDTVRIPFLQLRTASIHERDIADVAAAALATAGHEEQAYWLTGPAALTQQEHIETIGAVLGRAVDLVEVSPDDVEPPWPEFLVRTVSQLMNEPCVVTSTVEDVTGTPARTFRRWAEDHAADFNCQGEG
ncbi:NAD(P)H-binding protein [Amycolatopsis sp. OK19-0408]|uniref:NAD(P)H-binding protein n=1 Tax=Amycolatopsis iheyensis TaxID=2945988 RepID=A0A9X2NH91_9PSEU|nr:NAD(P)H-binding protein [Amycolatopsis iheyensis]MCR6488731.1 NAD(P)H-binding protein [Amycolatopsis iheyensis]